MSTTVNISPPSRHPALPHNARRLAEIAQCAAEQAEAPALAVPVKSSSDPRLELTTERGRPRKSIYSDLGERWDDMEEAAKSLSVTKNAVYQAMANEWKCKGRMLGHKAFAEVTQ